MGDPTRSDIRFWFRGETISVSEVAPQKTVLRWLREDKMATGTKEGCAEGDCGACTVAVGSLDGSSRNALSIRAVNSCLLFLPALDGKALFTVEDVAAGGELHPVQRAMVDLHASQCGFCTPGFVMSLWADYQEREGPPDRDETAAVLSGNLCRCTGYRPIIDAAAAAWNYPAVKLDRGPVVAALKAIDELPPLAYEAEGRRWDAPKTADDLAVLAETHPRSRLVAGATDIGLRVTKALEDLGDFISVASVDELRTIRAEGDELVIGAGVALTDAFRALTDTFPELAELAGRFAGVPVRNAGTLGGNVANGSPIGDSLPVLLALGASVILRKGSRTREVPLDAFYTGYQKNVLETGEVITAIRVRRPQKGTALRAWKVSKRRDQDISAVCASFALIRDSRGIITTVRLAYGGMAAVPARARRAEAALIGRPFDEAGLAAARAALDEEFSPLTDGRATADYRRTVAKNLLTRFYADVGP